jgi:hypothetical protein
VALEDSDGGLDPLTVDVVFCAHNGLTRKLLHAGGSWVSRWDKSQAL